MLMRGSLITATIVFFYFGALLTGITVNMLANPNVAYEGASPGVRFAIALGFFGTGLCTLAAAIISAILHRQPTK